MVNILRSKSKVWRCIWHAEAHAKCRSLVWRACNEELPVKSLLLEKRIIRDATCPFCGNCTETTVHALLMCEEVRRVWFASPLGLRVEALGEVTSLTQWIEQCACILDDKAMGMVCAIMWALWHKRNVWVFEEKKLDFEQVMGKVRSLLARNEWVPPPLYHVKANFAAVVRDGIGIGMGVIFRNSLGAPLASGTSVLDEEYSAPEIADAICYKWAVEQSGELGYSNVIFETDCKILHSRWNLKTPGKSNEDISYLDSLLEECKIMIEGTGSSFGLVQPTANEVARRLAAVAFDYGEKVWMQVVPEEASLNLQSDMPNISELSAYE